MNELEKAREIINDTDKKTLELFCKRMDAAKQVALFKKQNALPIFDKSREEEVISRNLKLVDNPEYTIYCKQLLQTQMDISKSYQKHLLADDNTITMNLADKSYNITVKSGALKKADEYLNLKRRVLIVTDDGVPKEYSDTVAEFCENPIIAVFPQGEDTKSFENMKELCEIMLVHNFTRKDCVVAVGGGVIGDLSGFAAASYMRGIDFYNIPTTLLSQVDSSIGGKVAVNLGSVKNIVGAFYHPKAVLIDPDVLKTLPYRQLANGLAEAVKMAATSDKELFELIENEDIERNIETIITKSLLIKKSVVEEDEKENSIRRVLNFGHTIGHAIEAQNFGRLFHGECVALGMLPMCSENVKSRLLSVYKKLRLPTKTDYEKDKILQALSHDKKAEENGINAVFVDEIGSYRFKKLKIEDFEELI
ncbi:MAG: 3-dehydroquinate synthase [Clostridiales bacterium]|nr:3-dehydroquinate synthase [Candidatus Equinaster intestinalis]